MEELICIFFLVYSIIKLYTNHDKIKPLSRMLKGWDSQAPPIGCVQNF